MQKDKSKIIDLWQRKRTQQKNKRKRNFLKRLIAFVLFVFLNGFLIYFYTTNLRVANYIDLQGLNDQAKLNQIKKGLYLHTEKKNWLFFVNRQALIERIKNIDPLVNKIEIKKILWPQAKLKIIIQEDLPWVYFGNGWLLTSSGYLIEDTEKLNFDELAFASSAVLFAQDKQYEFWKKEGKKIQKLIYSINTQMPEKPLKGIFLNSNGDNLIILDNLQINLGFWDAEILDRAALLSSLKPVLQKYNLKENTLNLKNKNIANLKLN